MVKFFLTCVTIILDLSRIWRFVKIMQLQWWKLYFVNPKHVNVNRRLVLSFTRRKLVAPFFRSYKTDVTNRRLHRPPYWHVTFNLVTFVAVVGKISCFTVTLNNLKYVKSFRVLSREVLCNESFSRALLLNLLT